MTAIQITLLVVVVLVELVFIVFCWRRMILRWREFRAGKGQPLLKDITDDDLNKLTPEWPLNDKRWPPPNDENNKKCLSHEMSAAYGRLARRSARIRELSAEVFLLVGSAWLGLRLGSLWLQLQNPADLSDPFFAVRDIPTLLPDLLPMLVIATGSMLRYLADLYSDASNVYATLAREPAKILAREPAKIIPITSTARGGIRGWLRRIFLGVRY